MEFWVFADGFFVGGEFFFVRDCVVGDDDRAFAGSGEEGCEI